MVPKLRQAAFGQSDPQTAVFVTGGRPEAIHRTAQVFGQLIHPLANDTQHSLIADDESSVPVLQDLGYAARLGVLRSAPEDALAETHQTIGA
jgi:hypothetical protein